MLLGPSIAMAMPNGASALRKKLVVDSTLLTPMLIWSNIDCSQVDGDADIVDLLFLRPVERY